MVLSSVEIASFNTPVGSRMGAIESTSPGSRRGLGIHFRLYDLAEDRRLRAVWDRSLVPYVACSGWGDAPR
jgi:hypothetical protein